MNQIIVAVDENPSIASSEGYSRKNRDNPMHIRRTSPREPKFASSQTNRRDTNYRNHGFRRDVSSLWVFFVGVDEAATERFEDDG